MTSAIIALAVFAAGLGLTAAAIALRLAGVRGELGKVNLLLAAEQEASRRSGGEAALALEEMRQLRTRHLALEEQRRAELEELEAIAARCSDPAELRRQLTRLTSPKATP